MHQRAVDVNLMPEIQMPCIKDLALYCNDRLNNGEVLTIVLSNGNRTEWSTIQGVIGRVI